MSVSPKKTKNKDFLKWSRAESCYRKDNIISTDWHERLERLPLFVPSYAKTKPDMVYIMSMEYGRIWQKEKNEWFNQIFKPQPKEDDINKRRRKLRMEFLEAKRQAEIKIRERKERLQKEAEAKAKAEAEEKSKKIKAKQDKGSSRRSKKKEEEGKKIKKSRKSESESEDKKNREMENSVAEPEAKNVQGSLPNGWTEVELTVQCACAGKKSNDSSEDKEVTREEEETKRAEEGKEGAETGAAKAETPCSPDCVLAQVANAVERSQHSPNDCEQVQNSDE